MKAATQTFPPTVDVAGAAELLKVHPESVLDLIAQCVIPAGKIGRAYVMLTEDVLAYAQKVILEQTAQRMRSIPATQSMASAYPNRMQAAPKPKVPRRRRVR